MPSYNLNIKIPKEAEDIIRLLNARGFEAFVVGGCVRDSLLGRVPDDWDITTDATPDEIKSVFHKTIDTGIEHGTVTVRMGGKSYEVTTYRIDGKYSDLRHPDSVTFTPNLKEDLLRRDFTINAMAYSPRDGLIDYYGGTEDLKNCLIRCVGDPMMRFTEDALRMIRAVRFSATLGFDIEEQTYEAAKKLASNIAYVSAERIQVELRKLLMSDNPDRVMMLRDTHLADGFMPQYGRISAETDHTFAKLLKLAEKNFYVRLAIMLSFVTDGDPTQTRDILKKLKFDNQTLKITDKLVSSKDFEITSDEVSLRRQIRSIGRDIFPLYMSFRKALVSRDEKMRIRFIDQEKSVTTILTRNDPTSVRELALSGNDLIENGVKQGPMIGMILEQLLDEVIIDPTLNTKEMLWTIKKNMKNG